MTFCTCGEQCHGLGACSLRSCGCASCHCEQCTKEYADFYRARWIQDWNFHISDKERLSLRTHQDALGRHYTGCFLGPDGQIAQQLVIVDQYMSQMMPNVRGYVASNMCQNFAKLCQDTYEREVLQELIDVAHAVDKLSYHWRINPRNRNPHPLEHTK